MTPEQAREIYHAARLKAMQRTANWSKAIVQNECDLEGWKAVIEALTQEPGAPIEAAENAR